MAFHEHEEDQTPFETRGLFMDRTDRDERLAEPEVLIEDYDPADVLAIHLRHVYSRHCPLCRKERVDNDRLEQTNESF